MHIPMKYTIFSYMTETPIYHGKSLNLPEVAMANICQLSPPSRVPDRVPERVLGLGVLVACANGLIQAFQA
jgi:hypothetical protein